MSEQYPLEPALELNVVDMFVWRRTTRHPYTGELVVCAAHAGEQHSRDQGHTLDADRCEQCGATVLACHQCRSVVCCCPCGAYHALECPWPL